MTMMTTDLVSLPDRVMLDANVLIAASDHDRPEHHQALQLLSHWPARGVSLCTSGQVLREYLSVATRPASRNGLGIPLGHAVANARAFRSRTTILDDTDRVTERLLELLASIACTGKQVHDANVVATMLAHKVSAIVTMNLKHFARFDAVVTAISL